MEFIINHNVKFSATDNTLLGLDEGSEPIILSRLCGELLCLFVAHNHQPLSRNMLLHELWEKRGLNASSNNLNNYVSMLRKALAHYGHSESISTIPKYGFVFDAEINMLGSESQSNTAGVNNVNIIGNNAGGKASVRERKYLRYLSGVIAGVVLVLFYFSPEIQRFASIKMARNEVFRIENCRTFLADDTTRRMDPDKLKSRVQDIVRQENLNCRNNTNLYFYADIKSDADGVAITRQLLSYCPFNSKAPCENYYFTQHGEAEGNHNEK
ncbi:DNA-binding winged helix-turn-helix (wHTH) domain-containing protein [Enterobacter sp. CC120223-11]|nr:DNA-binding winged helix-turn-helix (wHTH) domain-containing protein [Enterobacter sp. CC120223-11]